MTNQSSNICVDTIRSILFCLIHVLVSIILLPLYVLYFIYLLLKYFIYRHRLKNKLICKKIVLTEEFAKLREHLIQNTDNHVNNDTTTMSLTLIQDQLHNKQITCKDVLHAYQLKCLELHSMGNFAICQFIGEAEEMANKIDKSTYKEDHKNTLYGIPVSVKELCSVKGYDATFGLIKRCANPIGEDCVLIRVLKSQGAIPFVLTATSHLAASLSGINPIFGDMSNPISKDHEPGGSSSGEGVLLKLHGSPIGIGTDLGGSVRIPSSFCGLVGLKPTSSRLSRQGMVNFGNFKAVEMDVVPGPMGQHVDDLAKFMRTVLCPLMFNLDTRIPPLAFNESLYRGLENPQLKIGYYDTFNGDLLMPTVPSIRRAIQISVNYLKECGHEVIPFMPPSVEWAYELSMRSFSSSMKHSISKYLFAEPFNKHTGLLQIVKPIPYCLKWLLDKLVGLIIGKPAGILRFLDGPRGEKQTMQIITNIIKYRQTFCDAWIENGNFDAIICPISVFPAVPKSANSLYVSPSIAYTLLYNLVDYPAGTVSVGRVNQDDLDNSKEAIANNVRNTYFNNVLQMQSISLGLPLGVQIVGKPFQEEIVLRVMRELECLNQTNI